MGPTLSPYCNRFQGVPHISEALRGPNSARWLDVILNTVWQY